MTASNSASNALNTPPAATIGRARPSSASRRLFWALAILMLAAMLTASQGYGINWDEPLQQRYGGDVLRFYQSWGRFRGYIDERTHVHLYGALVEVLCVLAGRISAADIYDTRHFVVACFGFAGVLFTGLIAARLAGWRTGILALLFAFLTPVFFGHSMYNSKDIPFASAYAGSVYFLVRFLGELPKPRLTSAVLVTLSIATAINIRVGGLVLIMYLFLGWFVRCACEQRRTGGLLTSPFPFLRHAWIPLTTAIAAYFCGTLLWPYALTNPLTHPIQAYRAMSHFAFDSYSLFAGEWIHSWETPWNYLPTWIAVTTPPFITIGVLLVPALLVFSRLRATLKVHAAHAGFVVLAAVFPVAFVALNGSNVYDGWRHLLFIYPPLAAICAVAWNAMIVGWRQRAIETGITIALGATMLQPAAWMVSNHPFESFYFTPFIGGGRGAFGKYEIDYYGTSLRQAVEWIAANARPDDITAPPVRVRSRYGLAESAKHFVAKYSYLQFVSTPEKSSEWDYSIVLPVQAKYDRTLLDNWPPQGTIYTAAADDAPIFAIVRNDHASARDGSSARIGEQ